MEINEQLIMCSPVSLGAFDYVCMNHRHVGRMWCVNINLYTLFRVRLWFVGVQNMDNIVGKVVKKQVIC